MKQFVVFVHFGHFWLGTATTIVVIITVVHPRLLPCLPGMQEE